ncbi:MAG: carbamoyl-phosphate synthase large subunit [Candidatus Makana argininalis]
MPKRKDIKSILILGSGPIIIGQACEFDYSGTQACRALLEEGYRIILVNSNPATIMTDPEMANSTYIEPVQWEIVRKIIEKERPDALLPTMGGQTALNCALDLDKKSILKEFNVEIIGSSADAIDKAENRNRFIKSMKKIGLETAKSGIAHNIKEAISISKFVGFPCIIRPSFTMGGSGGGIAYNKKEFITICNNGFNISPTNELIIDESLIGWKEYEMEIVRDKKDNCIIVCSIENIDPMGIHTGDSITVAPAQTLTDKEYQNMRNASISVLKEIGVENGGSNVQFAINPQTGRMIIIEMNPRVSRSSALASKATGFPIAKISAKLSIGYNLDELINDITEKKTPASFEPSIDYVVTKIPRFSFEKFYGTNNRLTTQMKSVGEVMAIGRTQKESLQKAIRSLEIESHGFDSKINIKSKNYLNIIENELKKAGSNRLWYIADAFRIGMTIESIFNLTGIDPWFLFQIQEIINTEKELKNYGLSIINYDYLYKLKSDGFSDHRISILVGTTEKYINNLRKKYNLHPVYKRVDTCAAEFSNNTAYMYSTYDEECESNPTQNKKKIIIIGSGPNRIGQGIEFDYCCVHAALALREDGYEIIMINCNPETVSTDYDISNRLYFEPITLEDILEIVRIEKPKGVIIQYGGQTPIKLSKLLKENEIKIIGTSIKSIECSEDRYLFKKIIKKLKLKQPENATVTTIRSAIQKAYHIGYPLVVRPSYVLGGRAMEIVYNEQDLINYFDTAVSVSNNSPVLLDKFLDNSTEIDVDIVCDGKNVLIGGIMEHIEQAGIHSGDSACSFPSYTINSKIQNLIKKAVIKLSLELKVIGLMNAQFAIQNNKIFLIEVNLRASRTIPFISKAIGIPLAKVAARVITGKSLLNQHLTKEIIPKFFFVKEVVLPFNKFDTIDPILGPEMKSTGEVMGIGKTFNEAFYKANLGINSNIKTYGRALISVRDSDKLKVINLVCKLINNGFDLDATKGTKDILEKYGINARLVKKINEGYPNIHDRLENNEYNYILNTTSGKRSIKDSKIIRKIALKYKVHFDTTLNGSFATLMCFNSNFISSVVSLQNLSN